MPGGSFFTLRFRRDAFGISANLPFQPVAPTDSRRRDVRAGCSFRWWGRRVRNHADFIRCSPSEHRLGKAMAHFKRIKTQKKSTCFGALLPVTKRKDGHTSCRDTPCSRRRTAKAHRSLFCPRWGTPERRRFRRIQNSIPLRAGMPFSKGWRRRVISVM